MNLYSSDQLIEYLESLRQQKASRVTIKNYLADVRQFLNWRSRLGSHKPLAEDLGEYLLYASAKYSSSSLKRKSSALQKYLRTIKGNSDNSRKENLKYLYTFLGITLAVVVLSALSSQKQNEIEIPADTKINDKNIILPVSTAIGSIDKNTFYKLDGKKGVSVVLPPDTSEPSTPADMLVFQNVPATLTSESDLLVNQGITNKGNALLRKGTKEVLVVNDFISENSFLSITPQSPTGGNYLYVKAQKDGFAVIAIEAPVEWDIEFSWKADNTEVYHSIL